jgi:hypothetical protein
MLHAVYSKIAAAASACLPPARVGLRGRGVHAVDLHQDLRLDTPAGLVLAGRAARGTERVDLVDEDGRRRGRARHLEQAAHHALRLAPAHAARTPNLMSLLSLTAIDVTMWLADGQPDRPFYEGQWPLSLPETLSAVQQVEDIGCWVRIQGHHVCHAC